MVVVVDPTAGTTVVVCVVPVGIAVGEDGQVVDELVVVAIGVAVEVAVVVCVVSGVVSELISSVLLLVGVISVVVVSIVCWLSSSLPWGCAVAG